MLNEVILVGRLAQDPELRYTPAEGVAVANFSIAVDRPYTDPQKKETDFIRIVTWRKQAENCANYLSKGRLVAVAGRLQIRQYEDKDGIKRSIAEVVARTVKFLPDGKGKNGSQNHGDEFTPEFSDEDVPF